MEINREKIAEFNEYCKQCKFRDLPETEDPCFDCLAEPVNVWSHKPTRFKERTNK
jgi:hypothetical protein